MKKEIKKQKLSFLDYACKVGERVQWANIKGEKFEGVLKAWNDYTATVTLDSGTEMFIDC
jgi:hypothetical protein